LIFYLFQPVDWHLPNRKGLLRPNVFALKISQTICVTIIRAAVNRIQKQKGTKQGTKKKGAKP
jgi:hypothetical protein